MRFIDWFLFGCLLASSGAGAYAVREANRLVDEHLAFVDLDCRHNRATEFARAVGQTDILHILEGTDQ